MADGVIFDFSQINILTADLGKVAEDSGPKIIQALEVSAFKIKKEWQQKLEGTPDVPHGSASITYDVGSNVSIWRDAFGPAVAGANEAIAEIGAEDGREQAPIVAVLEYGSPINNLPPHGYGAASLQDNSDDFQHGLELAIGDPLDLG